jgi:hypothetical protein
MVEDIDTEREKMLNNDPTEDDLKWIKQKTFEMRRATAIKRVQTRNSRISERERIFWEKQKNEKQ